MSEYNEVNDLFDYESYRIAMPDFLSVIHSVFIYMSRPARVNRLSPGPASQ